MGGGHGGHEPREGEHLDAPGRRLVGERVGQRPVGVLVVVAEGLAVGGEHHGGAVGGRGLHPRDECLAREPGEREREVVGQRPVVEDERERPLAVGVEPAVRHAGDDGAGVDVGPAVVGAAAAGVERPDPGGLARRQHDRLDALLDQDGEHPLVGGRLGQPHRRAAAPEPVGEVGEAPAHLGAHVAVRGQRQDDVVVRLGDGATGGAVGRHHPGLDVGVVGVQPRQQRGAEVEAEVPVVVDDVAHPAVVVDHPGPAVGPVALVGDPLVPVVERRRRRLDGHLLAPGVLAGRLVEVAVDDEADRRTHGRGSSVRHCRSIRSVTSRFAWCSKACSLDRWATSAHRAADQSRDPLTSSAADFARSSGVSPP